MQRLPVRLLLFFLPVIPVLGLAVFILYSTGETGSAAEAARRSVEKPVLYGLAYTKRDGAFKRGALNLRRPNVVCMGSSRVLEVRSEFFTEPSAYYNAGITGISLYDELKVIRTIHWNTGPRLLILGVDSWWFNDDCKILTEHSDAKFFEDPGVRTVITQSVDRVLKDVLLGKLRPGVHRNEQDLKAFTPIGMSAIFKGAGFRSDGSYRYESGQPREWPGFAFGVSEVRGGNGFFAPGTGISQRAVAALRQLLQICREQGVHVVAYVPPYASPVYRAVQEAPSHYPHMLGVQEALRPIFAEGGSPFYDYQDIHLVSESDEDFLDGIHPGERTHAQILQRLAKVDPPLRATLNAQALASYAQR